MYFFNPSKLSLKKIKEIGEYSSRPEWYCEDCGYDDIIDENGNEMMWCSDFIEQKKIELSKDEPKIKNFKSFNAMNSDDQRYLDKLRRNYPNRDIPSDSVVSEVISKLRNGKEKVIDDLIIRKDDDQIEFELI